jgi:transposase
VVFITVLHRLFAPGSDRAAERWCRRYALGELSSLDLQHFYRTMGWLGEPLPADQQPEDTAPFGPRLRKDLIEEALFRQRRDLFTGLRLIFIDTTSIYFEGRGGETIGKRGYSKDHRPDLNQTIVAMVTDDEGRPVCCEMLPGNTADITTLVPIVDRLRNRFDIRDVCVVADRGMISKATMEKLTERKIGYILGARLRNVKEIRETVLSRGGRYRVVHGPREHSKSPSPLKVKQMMVDSRRYIVCHNEEQHRKDRADREAILEKLRAQLKQGGNSLVGNKGFRKYLTASGSAFQVDEAKVRNDERFDGKWVLQTDTDLPSEEVALRYKDLLMVEDTFRTAKSILDTRPIFHKCDDTIRGHVFCSFLALVLLKELQARMHARGWSAEWKHLRDDLDELQELTLPLGDKNFIIRTPPIGSVGRAIQAVGAALGPSVRRAN